MILKAKARTLAINIEGSENEFKKGFKRPLLWTLQSTEVVTMVSSNSFVEYCINS